MLTSMKKPTGRTKLPTRNDCMSPAQCTFVLNVVKEKEKTWVINW